MTDEHSEVDLRLDDLTAQVAQLTSELTDLRRQVIVVDQDPFIFNASMAENIRYARPDASDADVIAALGSAQSPQITVVLAGDATVIRFVQMHLDDLRTIISVTYDMEPRSAPVSGR